MTGVLMGGGVRTQTHTEGGSPGKTEAEMGGTHPQARELPGCWRPQSWKRPGTVSPPEPQNRPAGTLISGIWAPDRRGEHQLRSASVRLPRRGRPHPRDA